MKRGFVRGLWGIYNKEWIYKRRYKMDNDVELLMNNPYSQPFKTYVFGTDNYKYLVDKGFDCKLVDEKPILYGYENTKQHAYGHKLRIFKEAMNDFDEIVFLDWDTQLAKELPENFWEVLGQKASIQAIIRGYKKTKCPWRKKDKRKRPCASFVYINDKKIADEMMEMWEKRSKMAEEQIMAKYTDDMVGGWKGIEKYWELFEPDFFVLGRNEVPWNIFAIDLLKTKNICFTHLNKKRSGNILKKIRGLKDKARIEDLVKAGLQDQLNTVFGRDV